MKKTILALALSLASVTATAAAVDDDGQKILLHKDNWSVSVIVDQFTDYGTCIVTSTSSPKLLIFMNHTAAGKVLYGEATGSIVGIKYRFDKHTPVMLGSTRDEASAMFANPDDFIAEALESSTVTYEIYSDNRFVEVKMGKNSLTGFKEIIDAAEQCVVDYN